MTIAERLPREPMIITVPEAAKLLRVSRAKAYQLAAAGELPGTLRVGRSLRVNRVRLVAWIDAESSATPAK